VTWYAYPGQFSMSVPSVQVKRFVEAAREVARRGLVQCSSGNLSWRVDDRQVLLSASRAWLERLTTAQVAVCELEGGRVLNDVRPTCEVGLHLEVLRRRARQNVVLHFQSPYATAIACAERTGWDFNVIIEVPVYIGTPAVVPYLPPGSAELARAVAEAMVDHDMAILRNHGLVTVGRDFDEAIQRAVFFELACRILCAGPTPKPLDAAAVERLRRAAQA